MTVLSKLKVTRAHLALLGIICFFIAVNLIWIKNDQAPPMWDQSHYLFASDILYHKLTKEGLISFIRAFTHALEIKAPLITALPIPFYLLAGDNYASALFVNIFFIVFGSYYLFKLVTLISGKREALLSIFIFNLFPLIFAMSREFLVEYGLTVFVIAWMYYLLKSEFFENRKDCYALGIVLGIGMLMKITFALFIMAPTIFIIICRIIYLKELPKTLLKNMGVIFVMGLLISGIWYFQNLKFIINFAIPGGYGNIASYYGMGDVFSLETILKYWIYIINYGISSYFFVLIILLLLQKLILFMNNKPSSNIERDRFYFLFLWFTVPFIIFTFGVNKDYRYLSPVYPVLAILMSSALVRLSAIRYGTPLLITLMLFPTFNYFFVSFSSKPIYVKIKQFEILNNNLAYAHPPVKELWPNKRLIQFIRNDAVRTNNDHARTTLLFDHPYMNFITLNYYSRLENTNLSFDTNGFLSKETLRDVEARIERDSDYLVTKSDNLGPEFLNVKNVPILASMEKGELGFRQIGEFPLPDKTLLTIYKRDDKTYAIYSSPEGLTDYKIATKNAVNFSDKIKLLDYKITKGEGEYKLTFFWECLNPIDKNYKIFVHVIDPEGRPLLNADHYPASGKYPTNYWRKGELIREEIGIASALPANFHIYVGIYEEETMSRLSVNNERKDNADGSNGVKIY